MKYLSIILILLCGNSYGQKVLNQTATSQIVLLNDSTALEHFRDTNIIIHADGRIDILTVRIPNNSFDTIYVRNRLYVDTTKNGRIKKTYYGFAGIKQPIDSTKYYYLKFLYFNNKLNDPKLSIKKFDMIEDSAKRYLDLLNRKRK